MYKARSQSTFYNKYSKRNRRKKILIVILLFLSVIFSFFVLKNISNYQNMTLQSIWQSEETGQVLSFSPDGTVLFSGNLPSGIYHIISPNMMEYTINEQTFQMIYQIKDQKLYWGLNETSLETFRWLGNKNI